MRKMVLLLGLVTALFLLAACRAPDDLIQVPEGYSLTATHMQADAPAVLNGFQQPPAEGYQEKMYVKKFNSRIDSAYRNKERRWYEIVEGNSIAVYNCKMENGKWDCDKTTSELIVPEDLRERTEQTTSEWVQELLSQTGAEQIADRQIIGINAKCFSYPDGSISCYHPTALIPLYHERVGYSMEVTSLDLTAPDDGLFAVP